MSSCCETCTSFLMGFSIIHSSISIMLITTVIYAFHVFIKKRQTDDQTASYFRNGCIIAFNVCTILSIFFWNLYQVGGDCYHLKQFHSIIEIFSGITYGFQGVLCLSSFKILVIIIAIIPFIRIYLGLLVSIIFFEKCASIFKKAGAFRLSKHTENGYRITFLIQLLYILGIVLLRALNILPTSYTVIAFFIGVLMYSLVTLSLVGLFIHKLIQVYRNLNKREYNDKTEFLMEPITKVTILCSVSLIMTLMNILFGVAWMFVGGPIIGKFCKYTGLMDLYTNFICILLCNKIFKEQYLMICSCLDKRCKEKWKQIVYIQDHHGNTENNLPSRVNSASTPSHDVELAKFPDIVPDVQ